MKQKFLKFTFDKILNKFLIIYEKLKKFDFIKEIEAEEANLSSNKVSRSNHSIPFYYYNVLKRIKIDQGDSILDIGCSKGLALHTFSKFNFGKIDGLEISPILANIATKNFKNRREIRYKKISIINENALTFKGYGNYNFFYFYNSIYLINDLRKIMQKLMINVKNKEIIIIFNNTNKIKKILDEYKNLYIIGDFKGAWNHRILLLSNKKNSNRLKY